MAQWPDVDLDPVITPRLASLATAAALTLATWTAGSTASYAQVAAPQQGAPAGAAGGNRANQVVPANDRTLSNLFVSGAATACFLSIQEKLSLKTSIVAASQGIAASIATVNDSQVEGAGKLTPERLVEGAAVNILLLIKGTPCNEKLSAADKKFLDEQITIFEKRVTELRKSPTEK